MATPHTFRLIRVDITDGGQRAVAAASELAALWDDGWSVVSTWIVEPDMLDSQAQPVNTQVWLHVLLAPPTKQSEAIHALAEKVEVNDAAVTRATEKVQSIGLAAGRAADYLRIAALILAAMALLMAYQAAVSI